MNKKIFHLFKNWRFYLVIVLFSVASLAIIVRFYDLQIAKHSSFSIKAVSQAQAQQNEWQYLRGKIYFTDKNQELIPVAINKDFNRVFAVPKEIENPSQTAEKIADIFGLNAEELTQNFSKPNDLFELIDKRATDEELAQIKALDLTGIYSDQITSRFYPFQQLASQVLGFVKDDDQNFHGQYGLEKYYDNELSTDSNASGLLNILSLKNLLFSQSSYDLVSTIDYNIQKEVESSLKSRIVEWEAESGSVIVMEPATGKILAMANYPEFNPNEYSEFPLSTFINPSVEYTYEPGSIFKLITVSTGIENEKITSQIQYYDYGEVKVDDRTIKNWDLQSHGWQTVAEILAKSLNTGSVFVEQEMGHDLFYQGVLSFGINKKTGIDLPGEVKGRIDNLKGFQDIYFATASFGQGITATPLEMITAISAIANDGIMMKPYVIEKMVDADTGEEKISKPQEMRQVISEQTAETMKEMMINAVIENQAAVIKGYQIAGKTGTAQVADDTGKYGNDTIHSFVGFAPANNPQFIILVKIDKPQKAKFAGTTAIPVFKDVAQFILNYYEIPPTQ